MEFVENIYLQGSNESAVLLLHSFTSNAREMHYIANVLHDNGYTCYAPNLAGHGASPENLFASSMDQIIQHSKNAVQFLMEKKYERIYVVGQSLGGVLGLHLATKIPQIKALCIISSPVLERPVKGLENRVAYFSKRYLQNRGITEDELQAFLSDHFPRPVEKLIALQQFIVNTGNVVHTIKQPLFLAKGALDELVFQQSIDLIEQAVDRNNTVKKLYGNSGHLITLGKERDLLAMDVKRFLNKIEEGTV